MRRRRVALVVASVAAVGLAALAGLAYLASAQKHRLLAAVGQGLGREIRAERLGITLRGGAGVVLKGVEIADDPAFGAEAPFLTARRFELRLQVLPLVRRQLVVDRIDVDEPVVNLVRDRSGRLNVDSLGSRDRAAKATVAGGAPPAPAPADAIPPAFQLITLRLRDGTIRYHERGTGRTVELADVAVDARQPRFGAPVPISLRARLDTGDLRLEDIQSEGVLDLAGERMVYRGSLHAGPGALGELPLERLEAELSAAPPVLDLERSTVELLGGRTTGSAHLVSEGEGAGLRARFAASGLDLARLPARPDRPHPAGRLGFEGALNAPPPGAPHFKGNATGQGQFEVAEGRLKGMTLGRELLGAIEPFMKPGIADRLRTRYPDLFASDELVFTRLSGSGRLAGGRIRSQDLVCAGASYEAHGEGSMGLDGTLDVLVRVTPSAALTEDLLGDSKARPALVDASGRLTIPLRVRGSVQRPQVRPDASFLNTAARAILDSAGLERLAEDVLKRVVGPKHKRKR